MRFQFIFVGCYVLVAIVQSIYRYRRKALIDKTLREAGIGEVVINGYKVTGKSPLVECIAGIVINGTVLAVVVSIVVVTVWPS